MGTNSTRLLIAEQHADGSLDPVEMHDRITRLGLGFDASGNLALDAMQRVIDAILFYKTRLAMHNISEPVIFATSATRDAANAKVFLAEIKRQTGYTPRVLSGDQEARYSFLGAASDFSIPGKGLVIDIGGGSTEFIYSNQGRIVVANSLNIGSRRLTTRFLHHDPVTDTERKEMIAYIQNTLRNELPSFAPETVISVGGTACTLALMDQATDYHNFEKAHQYRLKTENLQNILNALSVKSIKERQSIKGLEPGRCDVILTGATIMYETLQFFGLPSAYTSLRDLMFGVLLEP